MANSMDKLTGRKVTLRVQWPAWDAEKNGPILNVIPAGTAGTVREYVSADTKGAHTDAEDCVVVEFAQPDGGLRAISIGLGELETYVKEKLL